MYPGCGVAGLATAHYALQVRANILVDSVRPLTYSQPAATNRLVLLNNKLHYQLRINYIHYH